MNSDLTRKTKDMILIHTQDKFDSNMDSNLQSINHGYNGHMNIEHN